MSYLLDTHILIWWFTKNKRLSKKVSQLIDQVSPENPLLLSEITLWEIAMLKSLDRIELDRPLREWLEIATAPPYIKRERLTPAIATEVAQFPKGFHRDPADRIIVATAKVLGATLVTTDKKIIDAEIVPTVC